MPYHLEILLYLFLYSLCAFPAAILISLPVVYMALRGMSNQAIKRNASRRATLFNQGNGPEA